MRIQSTSRAIILAAVLLAGPPAAASVIGSMTPAEPLTAARLSGLPTGEAAAWRDYLARSAAAHRHDLEVLAAERAKFGTPTAPDADGHGASGMALNRDPAWYRGPEAWHVAEVIVSFQTPAGGWSKNMPRTGDLRRPGESFAAEETYLGTLDNGATISELRFLARMIAANRDDAAPTWRASFERGVRYLLAAQYPNGGWPQVWPLAGGYHDAVTFNDGAMLAAMRLLADVAAGKGDLAFTTPALRAAAAAAHARALECLLAAQVRVGGRLTGWPQQADVLTLAPVGARNFEPISLASAESAGILLYLMSLPHPSERIAQAIDGGAAWFAATPLIGKTWSVADPAQGRRLTDLAGAPPLWSRYYDIQTARPIFGDRDRSIHDDVNDLSLERRNGYAWFNAEGVKVATAYAKWKAAQGRP